MCLDFLVDFRLLARDFASEIGMIRRAAVGRSYIPLAMGFDDELADIAFYRAIQDFL